MRRILLRLVVVAMFGAIAAVMAVPALAEPPDTAGGSGGCDEFGGCGGGGEMTRNSDDSAERSGGSGGCGGLNGCGGGGGTVESSGDFFPDSECNVLEESCSQTTTGSGGSGGVDMSGDSPRGFGGGGHGTDTFTVDLSDESNPVQDSSGTGQGGNSVQGGGNCTYEQSFGTEPEVVEPSSGPRCDQLFVPFP